MRRVRHARETAHARRDARVSNAVERADAELARRLGALDDEETTIVTEALALEGATSKEVALWLEMSSRAVNKARREQAGQAEEKDVAEDDGHLSDAG
ncbi:hypothetical protein D5R93_02260 [Actinomyces lilanjuaniae]|uniref:RNA polymerase sigma factor 70 region 4 type 2 domain-containing protein n=2 Tax=Actinomyces lilanjuaniae TaxID=2321394 RepID=A0ABN5PLY0_9ACTO|nr:hypothetical protein D5R93_02260 [Actinomyces lilanjuaniae]